MNAETKETYSHLLQRLGQHVAALLLVDEDDDGRLEAAVQHLQQLLPARHTNNNGGDSVSQSPTRYRVALSP